jgi:hypothetical protein
MSRRRIARTLNAAYAGGLLSDDTFAARIDQVLSSRLVDPLTLVGDLNLRSEGRRPVGVLGLARTALAHLAGRADPRAPTPFLLALDWSGSQSELLIGRHHACDVVLTDTSVSRQHARLIFRDAKWIVHDLQSTNGTIVNGTRVGRCEVRTGDYLMFGEEYVEID